MFTTQVSTLAPGGGGRRGREGKEGEGEGEGGEGIVRERARVMMGGDDRRGGQGVEGMMKRGLQVVCGC